MGTTKCITENKTKVPRFIFAFFSIFSFFNLSFQGNKYGNFRQRFLRNYLTLDFEIWYKHQVWQVVLCIKESATYGLSFPLFVLFSFFFFLSKQISSESVTTSDGYRRWYVSFAHSLLYFIKWIFT